MRRVLANPLVQLAVALLLAFGLVTVATSWLVDRSAQREAISGARSVTTALGRALVEPSVPRGLAVGDAAAVATFRDAAGPRLLEGSVRRVKIWNADGVVVYSDEPRLIGRRFGLDREERTVLGRGGTVAGLSDVGEPENRFERDMGEVVEVYTRIRSPEGRPLLYENYVALDDLAGRKQELAASFRPATIVGTAALTLLFAPLAWWLTRRQRRDADRRERLLRTALEASDAERRRIARDLHDGVVQDLAGAAFTLAGSTRTGDPRPEVVGEVADSVRHSLRSLRSLLVEIYPPDLHESGLRGALDDLLAPVGTRGTATHVDVEELSDLTPTTVALVWRVAQEAVRNATRHGRPEHLWVSLRGSGRGVRLQVRDDGTGFDPASPAGPASFGLRGMRDAAREAGGTLRVESAPGRGTTVTLEVDG